MPIVSCRPVSIAILTLVPTPSVAGDQDRVVEARALEVEQAAEAADLGIRARPRGRAHQRLDQLDQAVAGVDIDAGLRVGEALALSSMTRLPYVRNRRERNALDRRYTREGRLHAAARGCAGAGAGRGLTLSIPNLITLARILLVPVVVWAIASGQMLIAFLLFLAAGISDAVDGFLAKRFGMASELGAYLDPLADKVLIVSIYVALGITEAIPRWIVILVVSRDIMIVGASCCPGSSASRSASGRFMVSKLNTAAQIVLAGLVLASLGFVRCGLALTLVMALVAVLTLLSVALLCRRMGAAHGLGGSRR